MVGTCIDNENQDVSDRKTYIVSTQSLRKKINDFRHLHVNWYSERKEAASLKGNTEGSERE